MFFCFVLSTKYTKQRMNDKIVEFTRYNIHVSLENIFGKITTYKESRKLHIQLFCLQNHFYITLSMLSVPISAYHKIDI